MSKDFSCQNLRGRSFKNQNLEGANFSRADIRSTDFTGAVLRNANFSNTKAGLQKRWCVILLIISWLLSGISGFLSAFAGGMVSSLIDGRSSKYSLLFASIVLILIVIFFVVIIYHGLNLSVVFTIGAIAFTLAVAKMVFGNGNFFYRDIFSILALVVAGTGIFGVGVLTGGFSLVVVAFTNIKAIIAVVFATIIFSIAASEGYGFAFAEGGARVMAIAINKDDSILIKFGSIGVAIIGALLSAYTARQTFKGDEKYTRIRDMAVVLAAFGGTSFRNTDLTDADFTGANLKSADFRKAKLTRVCWQNVKMIDRIRPGNSYLQNADIRQVLVNGLGKDKNFDRQDLRGINFSLANLIGSSFIATDLGQANLQSTNLSNAKLVQTQYRLNKSR